MEEQCSGIGALWSLKSAMQEGNKPLVNTGNAVQRGHVRVALRRVQRLSTYLRVGSDLLEAGGTTTYVVDPRMSLAGQRNMVPLMRLRCLLGSREVNPSIQGRLLQDDLAENWILCMMHSHRAS